MADKNVQLHDASGNDLYPKTKAGNLTGTLGVENGGTGQPSIPAFLDAIATEYTDTGTVTGETRRTKTWTVSGSGILFVFGMTACDTTNSYGSTIVEIKQGSTVVAGEHARTDTRSGAAVTVSAVTMLKVTNGTTITVEGYSTKGGTKTVTARALALGCTLSRKANNTNQGPRRGDNGREHDQRPCGSPTAVEIKHTAD